MSIGNRPILHYVSLVEQIFEIPELTHASHEQNHTANAEKAANIIDLLKNLCS